uniref:Uncharacterized protein n=1 Tax=Anopheles dirus TaxID=7168 RepID=A0A182NGH7_9DIPT
DVFVRNEDEDRYYLGTVVKLDSRACIVQFADQTTQQTGIDNIQILDDTTVIINEEQDAHNDKEIITTDDPSTSGPAVTEENEIVGKCRICKEDRLNEPLLKLSTIELHEALHRTLKSNPDTFVNGKQGPQLATFWTLRSPLPPPPQILDLKVSRERTVTETLLMMKQEAKRKKHHIVPRCPQFERSVDAPSEDASVRKNSSLGCLIPQSNDFAGTNNPFYGQQTPSTVQRTIGKNRPRKVGIGKRCRGPDDTQSSQSNAKRQLSSQPEKNDDGGEVEEIPSDASRDNLNVIGKRTNLCGKTEHLLVRKERQQQEE